MAHQSVAAIDTIDELKEMGKTEEAEELRTTLKTRGKPAYTQAKSKGYIKQKPMPKAGYVN